MLHDFVKLGILVSVRRSCSREFSGCMVVGVGESVRSAAWALEEVVDLFECSVGCSSAAGVRQELFSRGDDRVEISS